MSKKMIRVIEKELDGMYRVITNHVKVSKALDSAKTLRSEGKTIKIQFEGERYSIEGLEAYILRIEKRSENRSEQKKNGNK